MRAFSFLLFDIVDEVFAWRLHAEATVGNKPHGSSRSAAAEQRHLFLSICRTGKVGLPNRVLPVASTQ
jgi:hypothetical protein